MDDVKERREPVGQWRVVGPAASGEDDVPFKASPFSNPHDSGYLGKWGSMLADFLFSPEVWVFM